MRSKLRLTGSWLFAIPNGMKKPSLAFADSNQGGLKFLLQAKGIQLNYSRKMYARYSFRKLANDSAFIA